MLEKTCLLEAFRWGALLLTSLAVAACGDDDSVASDAGMDARVADGGGSDGATSDGGIDGATGDGGRIDGATSDGGTDGATGDGGGIDGATGDGGGIDGATGDGGRSDGATGDGGATADGGGACATNRDCEAGTYCQSASCGAPGTCEVQPGACPLFFDPVCGCDGTTYGNACQAAMAGVSVASMGVCPCTSNRDCEAGTYCATGSCGGSGSCETQPAVCPALLTPVCGCDGTTYQNACYAAMAGVSVASPGACACASNADCEAGTYCQSASCGAPGTCEVQPEVCPLFFDPVCGCDGMTYGNACQAAMAGVSVASPGECL